MAASSPEWKLTSNKKTSFNSDNNGTDSKPTKRPFDKKQWREKKYKKNMGNLNEGQGFADRRKQIVMRQYHKLLKKEKRKLAEEKPVDVYSGENTSGYEGKKSENIGMKQMKLSAYKRAQAEHQQQQEEKAKKKQEVLRVQREREAALKKYKEKKIEKVKKLSRRTPKGQPFMKDRMELLLERIQRQMATEH